jgi:hypothetical protein
VKQKLREGLTKDADSAFSIDIGILGLEVRPNTAALADVVADNRPFISTSMLILVAVKRGQAHSLLASSSAEMHLNLVLMLYC